MRPTLPEAIAALADPDAATVGEIEDVPDAVTETVPVDQEAESDPAEVASPPSGDFAGMTEGELADEALASFDQAQAALQAGDFATYGEEQDRLGQILEALTALDGEPPEATPES